ncbi:hypothetical protein V3C99_003378 [Haemonchus contortus]
MSLKGLNPLQDTQRSPDFFPTGTEECLFGVNTCTSYGLYGNYCCGITRTNCCGYISIFGWIVCTALLFFIAIAIYRCKARRKRQISMSHIFRPR